VGEFPNAWKLAIVSPLFKSGDRKMISNYRPISILPVISKVLEKWVSQQIRDHLNNSLCSLHPLQFGFRSNYSTETANCYFIENVKSMLDRHKVVGAIFLDLRKAFDTVNHSILLSKLSHFNFSTNALKWVASYLSQRSQSVCIGSFQSEPLQLSTGVPQGSILGPLLFFMYINDLPLAFTEVRVQMYADNTVLYMELQKQQWLPNLHSLCLKLVNGKPL